ncbi:MAG: FAD-binding protein, partial [Cyanobacteria bacterium P01_A01_bin.17]
MDSTAEESSTPLERNLSVDVAIASGGIAGSTAALSLRQAGKTIAVVEAKQVTSFAREALLVLLQSESPENTLVRGQILT